jgi:succinate dehydrogenase / fumarate reductase membrane anchor subunit
MAQMQQQSLLRQAQEPGSARHGSGHWWTQRVTAIALVPLTFWFVASLVTFASSGYDAFRTWIQSPFTTVLLVSFLIMLFYHIALGLQVVIEDYVHHGQIKILAVLSVQFGCFAFAMTGIVATLRVACGG